MTVRSTPEAEEVDEFGRSATAGDQDLFVACDDAQADSSLVVSKRGRRPIASQLRAALARGELAVQYQGQWDLRTRVLTGVEALARWHHPNWGDISPSIFVPIAESDHLVGALGKFVMRSVLRQIADWDKQGLRVPHVGVNLSPLELRRPRLVESIIKAVRAANLEPTRVRFEITESIAISEVSDTIQTLLGLARAGFSLAIDDFGTGYSNLSCLRFLPVHAIKIDRSFVRAGPAYAKHHEILKAIIALAGCLRMNTIAEGVESREQARILRDLGCQAGQGFYFSHPMTGDEFAASLLGKAKRKRKIANRALETISNTRRKCSRSSRNTAARKLLNSTAVTHDNS